MRVKRTVLAQLAGARKGILLFHDIQPSTAHALTGILAELKKRGFKVVHLVPKATATTLPEYDAQAERLIAHRSVAAAKEPLASRAVTWSQTGGEPAGEVLPWANPHRHIRHQFSTAGRRQSFKQRAVRAMVQVAYAMSGRESFWLSNGHRTNRGEL